MNKSSSESESSCKRQENGVVPSSSERPLKKARFAWQVKGKYHLRNENPDNQKPAASKTHNTARGSSSSDSDTDSDDLVANTEQNLEILGDYLMKQDFNTLDSVIADREKTLLKPCTSISSGKLSYPRYVPSSQSGGSSSQNSNNRSRDVMNSMPMSMVHQSPSFNEDQCITRWQARQMAKGFIDNTINRVLDSWMVAPMPTVMDDNQFLALDVAEFINNLPGDNSIENEGILMAISAHGLQNKSNSSSSCKENDGCSKRNIMSASMDPLKTNVFPSPPSSPMVSDEETIQEFSNAIRESKETSENNLDSSRESKSNTDHDFSQFDPFLFPDASGSSSENDNRKSSYYDDNVSPNDDDMFFSADHFDFMDAAVSFAIQNKGLTSYGTDYG